MSFGDLSTQKGVQELNKYLATRSYITGFGPTKDDATTFNALKSGFNTQQFVHVARWFDHIASFGVAGRAAFPAGAPKAAEKKAAKKSGSDSDSSSDSDSDSSDMDLDDLDDSEDDEETKRMMAEKAEKVREIQARQNAKKGNAKSNMTIDVKPIGSETDIKALEEQIRAIEMDGLTWLGSALIDVAYGVKKIRIMCQIVDEKIPAPDEIRDLIEEFEDCQSTDTFAFQMA